MEQHDAAVIGAGAAGLAAAATLRRRGVNPVIFERASAVADSWRNRYDRLRLNTHRRLSDMPGYRFSREFGRYPSRDDVVAYLERYAAHHGLEIRFNTTVSQLERNVEGWTLHTSSGPIDARFVIVATGYDKEPFIPDWPGTREFTGDLRHAASYRNVDPYRGRDVLVVGSGNTASDVATDLAEGGVHRVRISIRTPPNIFPRDILGVSAQYTTIIGEKFPRIFDRVGFVSQRLRYGDVESHGLPRPTVGLQTHFRESCHGPMIDEGFVDAVKGGRIEVVAAVEKFDLSEVVLRDGNRIRPDVVLAATGYRRGLEPLVSEFGVLRQDGRPLVHGSNTHPNAPDLYFIGFVRKISGQLRPMRREAKGIARSIAIVRSKDAHRAIGPQHQPIAERTTASLKS